MSRHRSSSKRAPPEIGLYMECLEEDLEPSQIAYYTKAEQEFNDVQHKLDNYIKKMKAEVVEKGENCVILQINATPDSVSSQISTTTGGKTPRQSQPTQNYQQMVGQGILTRSTANTAGNTYLVMDHHLGFMPSPRSRQAASSGAVMVTTRAKSCLKKQSSAISDPEILTPPLTRTRDRLKGQHQTQTSASPQTSPQLAQQQIYSSASCGSSNYRIKVNAKQVTPPAKPTENNALGGLSAGSKTQWKPNPDDGSGSKTGADSKEVTFNKVSGKTFPSLVVVARPHLKVKYIPQTNAAQERSALDAKVKGVLMYTSTKFTEWLIQQGLIRSEQTCQTHVNNDLSPVKLKLGMYSDVSKFPYSGGYVWISDCCPSQFVSVFSGSIFEGAPHPPTTLLKLIYHWACQTNVQNVVQWVKVDNLYVKNFFTNMRAVCTQAVHEKYAKMGGPRKKIEVGVISLGTTSQDGNRRQVKVEVLGVLDQESKLIRLRAVEPLSDERSFKRRFIKILEPLEDWVSKDSTILTDFTVARAALNAMGFTSVIQVTSDSKYSNQNVMEYLRRIVPRMFQNTLSLLSRQIIQQFLDELVWREMWGPIPSQAFVNIVAHIAEQTKLDVAENFLMRLNKVASNPFRRWKYSAWKSVSNSVSNTKSLQGLSSVSSDSNSMVPTDPCETLISGKGIRTRKRAAEQSSLDSVTPTLPPKKIAKISVKDKMKKDKVKLVEKSSKKDKDTSDRISEEIITFINEGKQILLVSYYYGSRDGDESSEIVDVQEAFNVKCCICNKRFTENITLMKHMILHYQIEPPLLIDLKKVYQCDYCFLGFNSNSDLKTHLEEVHYVINGKLDFNLLCQICEQKFDGRIDFIYHMHRTHVELELPYQCGVCNFRTSVYKTFVDHFIQIHGGGGHVFCPYCLKVVTFSHNGVAIPQNVFFYVSHLEKHQRLNLIRNCNRCQLSFIHKGILDQHFEADHGSWKNETGVKPISEVNGDTFLMPEPGGIIKPALPIKTQKSPKIKNLFTVTKLKTLEIAGIEDDMACLECEGSLANSEHFTSVFNCVKCRYSTCCENAMAEHSAIFHEAPVLQFTVGKPTVLTEEMFCVCGYSSSSGNRIAKHMATCERRSVYSSRELAEAASFLKSTSDAVHDNAKQGEGQNVLNMLGLMRKSPEVAIMRIESVKKEVDEKEMSGETSVKEEAQKIKVSDGKTQEITENTGFLTGNVDLDKNTEQTILSDAGKENGNIDSKSQVFTQAKVPLESTVAQYSLNILSPPNKVLEVTEPIITLEKDDIPSRSIGSSVEMGGTKVNEEKTHDVIEEETNSKSEVSPKERKPSVGIEPSEQSKIETFEGKQNLEGTESLIDVKKEVIDKEKKLDEAKLKGETENEVKEAENDRKDSLKKEVEKEKVIFEKNSEEKDGNDISKSDDELVKQLKSPLSVTLPSGEVKSEGFHINHPKSPKRNKCSKKCSEKIAKDPESSNSLEKLIKKKGNKQREKNDVDKNANKIIPFSLLSNGSDDDGKNDLKKTQLEKRKTEGSEWKALKKIDYQRLETVEEEGQLSSEETPSKDSCHVEFSRSECENDNEKVSLDFFLLNKPKKHRLYNLVSISEQPESWTSGEESEKLTQGSSERTDIVEIDQNHAEPVALVSKGSLDKIVSSKKIGMMEILPIFSNTKFVCSRDAISIEEYEETESVGKVTSKASKLLKANVVKREGPLILDLEERATEKVGDSKRFGERKLRFKLLTDRSLPEKTSSPFINSLLVVTPFAVEKENLYKEKKSNDINICCNEMNAEDSSCNQELEDEVSWELKIIPAILCTILGLFSVFIGIAWKFYQPPRLTDYILEFVPFIQRRQMMLTRSATMSFVFDEICNVYNCVFPTLYIIYLFTLEKYGFRISTCIRQRK